MVTKTKRNKPPPSTAGKRGPQDRSVNRLTPAKLSKLLREPPTEDLIHDGGGLWLDNSKPAKQRPDGKPIYPRTGTWYYRYQLTVETPEGKKIENVVKQIGDTPSTPKIEGEYSLAEARLERDRLRLKRRDTPDLRTDPAERGPRQRRPFHDLDEFWPEYYDRRICPKTKKRCLLCKDSPAPLCRGTDPETGKHYSSPDVSPPKECRRKWDIWHKKQRWAIYGPIFGHRDLARPEGTGRLLDNLIIPLWNKAQKGKMMLWQIEDHYKFAIEQLRDMGIEGIANPAAMSWEQREKRFGEYTYKITPNKPIELEELPHHMARVRGWKTRKARGWELTVHLIHRTDEVMSLRYPQINWRTKTVTVAAEDRKGGTHDVPLTEYALGLLRQCATEDGYGDLLSAGKKLPDRSVFFPQGGGVAYDGNNRSMAKFVRNIAGQGHRTKMKSGDPQYTFTAHGMRNVFIEWGEKHEEHQHPPFSVEMLNRSSLT